MCGIVGRFNFHSHGPVSAELMKGMAKLLAHRGPDGEGVYIDGSVGLGHRRLSVIDLTQAGHQPMSSRDGNVCLTFNGEIYNFRELRSLLERRGHQFQSQSDTEVILEAYLEYGVKCVEHLRGMFAFAIWDARERRLFLARDRVGKKPLYYWLDKDGIAFASEPKSFLADSGFDPAPSLEAISHYLTYQYVPSPWSAFQGVQKLQPGHVLIVEQETVRTEQYWKLSYQQTYRGSDEDATHEISQKLLEATKCRLISDVPLGAFLSGGMDSSMIVGLMAQLASAPIKTFSIGFEQEKYNELPFARRVAEKFGTDHQEFVVNPEPAKIFPLLTWHYNEPFADSSAIPSMYLAEMTRQHVTVALNGDGGDENLAGYDRYVATVLSHRYDQLPNFLKKGIEKTARYLPDAKESKTLSSRIKRLASGLSYSPYQRYMLWMAHFDHELKTELCTKEFFEESGGDNSTEILVDAFEQSNARDLMTKTLDVDVQTYLPNDLLVKVDVATMAYGLEARSPFLDHEVMEFCASLPAAMKLRGTVKKFILKKAAKNLLPSDILKRPKMGLAYQLIIG